MSDVAVTSTVDLPSQFTGQCRALNGMFYYLLRVAVICLCFFATQGPMTLYMYTIVVGFDNKIINVRNECLFYNTNYNVF